MNEGNENGFDQIDQDGSNMNINDGDFIVNDEGWDGDNDNGLQLENSMIYKGNDDYYNDYQNRDPNIQQQQQQEEGGYDDNIDDEDDIIPGVDDLPLFALPEARKIDKDIKEKEKEMEIIVEKIRDMKDRVKVMKEHFKNVEQEVEHTNSLQGAKNAEIMTEKHLQQLSSRSLGRAQLDARKVISEIESIQDLLSISQNDIYRANEKMDEFKMQMNWNQEELEQWALAAKQKEDDKMALDKYTRADELKIKELSMQLEVLTKDDLIKRQALEGEATETQAKQMELDRIAVEFKKLHIERQSLVERWQETINEMKRRDIEINDLGERFAIAKVERTKKEGMVAMQQKRLASQLKENKEVENRSEVLGRIVGMKREEMMNGNEKLQQFRDELETLKSELTTAAEGLVIKRSDNNAKAQAMEEKRIQLERERQKYKFVKQKLADSKTSTQKAEDLAKQAEDDLERTEKEYSQEISKVKLLKDNLLKESQSVYDFKREEGKLRAELHGSKATGRNMEVKLVVLDREASRQQKLLYDAEFQIQQIERKVARGMGERSDEEKRVLRDLIEKAQLKKEEAKEKRKMLQAQVRKLTNELAASKNKREELKVNKTNLSERQGEIELENRMIEDEIKRDTKVKEEMTIQNDLLRLEVRRLRDLLSAKADAVFSLENRKQQLLLSMEERKQEIAVHKDVLKAELKSLNDDKHKLIIELKEREATIEKLKSRFDSVARGEDEGHSQSYYVIKAAQKREELQRRGDELDQDVAKCEREIRALQTTLDHLNARNIAYRTSFQKVDLNGEDVEILKQLEQKTKLARDSVFRKKKELQRLTNDYEEDERRLDQLRNQHSRILKQREQLENGRQQVEEETINQQKTLEDLEDKIKKNVLKHRTKICETLGYDMSALMSGTLEEKAARAEVLKDVVQNVLFTLGQLSTEFQEVSDQLNLKLTEADLRIPTKPSSRITISQQ